MDSHNKEAFQPIANLTVGEFREYLLSENTTTEILQRIKDGITPEMTAAVSKIMRNQDLISVSKNAKSLLSLEIQLDFTEGFLQDYNPIIQQTI